MGLKKIKGLRVQRSPYKESPKLVQDSFLKGSTLLNQMVSGGYETKVGVENNELDIMLSEFIQFFEEAKGLPPHKADDHRVVLKDGAQPVYTRP